MCLFLSNALNPYSITSSYSRESFVSEKPRRRKVCYFSEMQYEFVLFLNIIGTPFLPVLKLLISGLFAAVI